MKCSCCGSEITPIDGHCSVCGAPVLEEIDYENVDVHIDEPVKETAKNGSGPKKSAYTDKNARSGKKKNNSTKKQGQLTGKALFVGMGILTAIMVVLGIIGENTSENTEGEPSSVASTGNAVYKADPTKILEVEGVIYNDAGNSIDGLYGEDDDYIYSTFSYNKDHSAGALVDGRGNALYVNKDLQTIPMKTNALWTGISFNGEYMFVVFRIDYNYGLSLINIKSNKEYLIDDDVYYSLALSPDGTKIAYLKYTEDYSKELYIAGTDMETKLICSDVDDVMAISDDGTTVYYEVYDEEYNTMEYVWHDGKETLLTPKHMGYFLFNRDCTEAIYKDSDVNYYYKAGMDEPKALDCAEFYKIAMDVDKGCGTSGENDVVIYDTDTFEGGVIQDSENDVYLIEADYTLTKLGNNYHSIAFHARHSDKDVYIVENDKELIRYERDALGKLESKKILGDVNIDKVEINDDASIIWCFYIQAGKPVLCSIDENGETAIISDTDEERYINKMYWDSDTQKVYIQHDKNILIAISKEGEQEEISRKCQRLTMDHYYYPGIISFTDSNDRDYVSVFGQFVMVED